MYMDVRLRGGDWDCARGDGFDWQFGVCGGVRYGYGYHECGLRI